MALTKFSNSRSKKSESYFFINCFNYSIAFFNIYFITPRGWMSLTYNNNMVKSIADIEKYLKQFISYERLAKFPGQPGFNRMKDFLRFLGILKLPVPFIHIAGTSGKGSTATMISNILVMHGYKTGLSLSPHLLDLRDRIQINNQYISEKKLVN